MLESVRCDDGFLVGSLWSRTWHGMLCAIVKVNFPVDLRHTSYRRELRVYNVPYTHGLPWDTQSVQPCTYLEFHRKWVIYLLLAGASSLFVIIIVILLRTCQILVLSSILINSRVLLRVIMPRGHPERLRVIPVSLLPVFCQGKVKAYIPPVT